MDYEKPSFMNRPTAPESDDNWDRTFGKRTSPFCPGCGTRWAWHPPGPPCSPPSRGRKVA